MGTDVSTELAVMQAVGNALAQLPDNEARVRVLRWATDRVRRSQSHSSLVAVPSDTPAPAPRRSSDPMLSLDGVSDLFPNFGVHIRQDLDEDDGLSFTGFGKEETVEPLDALIRSLASDLGEFAIAWQYS